MPSATAPMAQETKRRIQRALENEFDPETRKDAEKLMEFYRKRGNYRKAVRITYIIGATFALVFWLVMEYPMLILPLVFVVLVLRDVFMKKSRDVQKTISWLVGSDPGRWLPVVDKLNDIISKASNFSSDPPITPK